MRRPIPVILTTILLGLFAALQLLGAAGMVALGFFTLHKTLPTPPGAPPSPLPPSLLPVVMLVSSLFYLALAVWCILTLIGLVRLRSWARYSVLVIAGLMATFSAFAMLVSLVMPHLMPTMPVSSQSGVSPHAIQGVIFLVIGAIYAVLVAIGVALLIYYNLPATRALFLQDAPIDLTPPNTSTGRPRPTAIAIISWFFMISSPFLLVYAFLPLPAYLFGIVINGFAARIVYVVFSLVSFAIGYGFYRLIAQARILLVAWMAFGVVNMLAVLTPWGSRNFRAYMDRFTPHYAAVTPNPFFSIAFIMVMLAISLAFYGFVLWLVHRHRVAFTPAPPPPPPAQFLDAPLAG